mmetsp:Transcript_24251/g.81571  ORF Transcript_24251/g.81571 Transcript_24251/m.81571 type:complete len:255 (+) Transcript_24251:174-938(+)
MRCGRHTPCSAHARRGLRRARRGRLPPPRGPGAAQAQATHTPGAALLPRRRPGGRGRGRPSHLLARPRRWAGRGRGRCRSGARGARRAGEARHCAGRRRRARRGAVSDPRAVRRPRAAPPGSSLPLCPEGVPPAARVATALRIAPHAWPRARHPQARPSAQVAIARASARRPRGRMWPMAGRPPARTPACRHGKVRGAHLECWGLGAGGDAAVNGLVSTTASTRWPIAKHLVAQATPQRHPGPPRSEREDRSTH